MEISEDKLKEGRKLAKEFGFKELFVNEIGEFFTNKSFAAMSVKYDKEKFAEVPLTDTGDGNSENEGGKATNDLGKAVEVIAAIEAETTSSGVIAILAAEAKGKNRKSVIDAGNKKLAAISTAAISPSTEDGKTESEDGKLELGSDETTKKSE